MDEQQRRVRQIEAGAWLREQRESRGVTQKTFARYISMDQSQLSKVERGHSDVTDEKAEDIARVIKMDIIAVRRGLGLWVPPEDDQKPQPLTLQDIPTDELFHELERRFAESQVREETAAGS